MKRIATTFILLVCAYAMNAQQPVIILEEQGVENAYPRLSKDGKTILYQSNRTGKWQLYVLDIASATSKRITKDDYNNNFPDWNGSNEWIAFVSDRDGNEELYMMKADGSHLQRLTSDPERDIHPYFSPDSKYLLFNSTRGGHSLDIYRMNLTSKKVEQITNTSRNETCARYSQDMKSIVFLGNDETSDDVFIMNMTNGLTENLTKTPQARDGWAMFSSDGKWVYYSGMEAGLFHIYRIRPDGSGREQITHAAKGEEDARAFISSDGKTLIYNKRKDGSIAIMSVPVG